MSDLFAQKRFLMIPGPTPVPESALVELSRHPLPHRSPEFSQLFLRCTAQLKAIAKTTQAEVFMYAASGTGAMEATLVNLLSPGDKVLSAVNGVFSKRWAEIAKRFGAEVVRLEAPLGSAVTPAKVAEALQAHPDTKLLLVTFSETSTGVVSPLQEIAQLTKDSEVVLAVDAITALGAIPLHMDDWGVDVVVAGSQKGFMIPPGLSFIWVSPKAWSKHLKASCPRYYWDWGLAKKALDNETTAFTPSVSLICALAETLKLMEQEGVENSWRRHERLKQLTRRSLEAMGLQLFAPEELSSAAITSILPPEGITVKQLRAGLKDDWKIVVADGQGELQGKIFRIGHLGYTFERDVLMALSALAQTLHKLGVPVGQDWPAVYAETLQKHSA